MALYKSPTHKVISFLEKSRCTWKRRAKYTVAKLKVAKKKISRLETRRSELNAEVKELKTLVSDLGTKLEITESRVKKKSSARRNAD